MPKIGTCGCCWGQSNEPMGRMKDPNGHDWWICKECINFLWDNRQYYNQADKDQMVSND